MTRTRSEVAAAARASLTYPTRMCMQWTRLMAGQEAVGDFDGDKAADAEDGWKSSSTKHPGDRHPPLGTMVFYGGGSSDNGHAAISLGPDLQDIYWIRSTDGAGTGKNGTVPINYPENKWGMPYLGWTEGIGDAVIANDTAPDEFTRGEKVDDALRKLQKVKGKPARMEKVRRAIEVLKSITPFKKR